MKYFKYALIIFLYCQISVLAQIEESYEYYLLFEETKTTSSTKTEIKRQQAPNTLYVFQTEELINNNIFTLQNLFEHIPSSQINPGRQGHYLSWLRGVQSRYNDKILLLIDGVPLKDFWYGNFLIDEMHPLEMIEKVEVIVGPGSVLYGANAFSGIINITTKSGVNEAYTATSSNKSYTCSTSMSYKNISFFTKYLKTQNGFSPEFGRDGKERRIEQDQSRELYLLNMNWKIAKNLTLNLSKTFYEYPFAYSKFERTTTIHRNPFTCSIGYETGNEDSWKLDILGYYVKYPFYEVEKKYSKTGPLELLEINKEKRNTEYWGSDIYFSKKISKTNLLLGLNYQFDRFYETPKIEETKLKNNSYETLPLSDFPKEKNQNYGIYLQNITTIHKNTDLTLGIRYDILDRFENQFSYRAGLVCRLDNNIYFKTVFGTAFRIPSYREYQKLNDRIPAYDSNLQPENLKTFEIITGKNWYNKIVNITFFYNIHDDFITDRFIQEVDDEVAYNAETIKIYGLELNGKFSLNDKLKVNPGISYLKGTNDQTKKELHAIAKYTGFINIDYIIKDKWSIGIDFQFVSDRETDDQYQEEVPEQEKDPKLKEGFINVNTNIQYLHNENLEFSLSIKNITNDKHYSPHFGPSNNYDYEWPGLEATLSILTKW